MLAKFRILMIAILALVAMPETIFADDSANQSIDPDFQKGNVAFQSGDFATAMKAYQPLAERGFARAQYMLGWMYEDGKGVPQDYVESLRYFRLAADQGLAEGQNSVGYFYDNGLGVPQDYVEAIKWYRLAAAQGFRKSQRNLGLMYARGNGTPQDYVEAVKLLRLASEQFDGKAQYNLGLMYKNGNGVPQNDDEALKLLLAASNNDVTLDAATQHYVGLLHQKSEKYSGAAEWYQLAADQGYVAAQSKLGILYANGRGVRQDFSAAVKWVRMSADQGFPEGQVSLGSMYEKGLGVLQNYSEAVKWYQLAADQGYADGQNKVGMMYVKGLGMPQSYSLGVKWLRLAAEQNNAVAQTNLGMLYDVAPGYPINGLQAEALSSSNIQMNEFGDAQQAVGPLDDVRAHMWYNIALSNIEGSEAMVSNAVIGVIYSPSILRKYLELRLSPSQISLSQSMASQCVNSKYKDCGW